MSGSGEPNRTRQFSPEDYRFRVTDLRVAGRLPGISAFMRVKNGADFLEAVVRSHLPHVNEIVIIHNQCTDDTPAIAERLATEFPDRVRVFNYLPRVHAPGSVAHAREPADSPASFVNQSNFALAQTRYRIALKLDDDHLAMGNRLAALTQQIRVAGYRLADTLCFSGINLARDPAGNIGVLAREPFAGAGDHFFFEVTSETHFIHHPRFEDFRHAGARVFGDFTYWHLKALKPDFGFANRDIETGNPRFARKRAAFLADRRVISLAALRNRPPRFLPLAARLPLPEKARLKARRWQRFLADPPDDMTGALAAITVR